MTYRADPNFAAEMDAADALAHWRKEFFIPKTKDGKECIYLCGNSLGLQPRRVEKAVQQELVDWQNLGVEGHFHAKHPWMPYHEFLTDKLAKLVGAKPIEVVAMNSLTVNLHLLMVSFYRPTKTRHKIIIEGGAFPSDQYAVASQIKFHGFDPKTSLIELKPRAGERALRTEDIEAVIEKDGDSVALIMLGGVNYYTGQLFDMERITKAGHKNGCIVGFDLAHAAGNVPLKLHDWDVDFACWCSYKYLNSGPGALAGAFVHEKHATADLPKFAGWWGHDKKTRFKMGSDFHVTAGAEGWQLSNPPILSLAAVRASLEIFDEVGMEALRAKSLKLTGYLQFLLNSLSLRERAGVRADAAMPSPDASHHPLPEGEGLFTVMTPRDEKERGCQISILMHKQGRAVFDKLTDAGVICDWREPDCIRVAPVPLYNSFGDVYVFVKLLAENLGKEL